MGERMKTQINRIEDTISDNREEFDSKINNNENDISNLDERIRNLENEDFQWQIDNLRERIENLENGG